MAERNKKLDEIANQFDENILAVKGTLELIDTSVTEDELHELLLKAIDRMDIIQRFRQIYHHHRRRKISLHRPLPADHINK